jgi:molybdopterin-guanine dinucleotide biosynthesis protein A
MTRIAGLVLAGGGAVRMGGGDKPLLELRGKPMLQRVLDTLAADHADIAISANGDAARFARFGRPVLPDGAFVGQGPLAGVLAGLDWAAGLGCAAVLSVPGDTPFVPPGLAHRLFPPPACVEHEDRVHHLVALWPVLARETLRALLSKPGPRGVAAFSAMIGLRQVCFDPGRSYRFANINTPAELADARHLAEELDDDADSGDRGARSHRPAARPDAG